MKLSPILRIALCIAALINAGCDSKNEHTVTTKAPASAEGVVQTQALAQKTHPKVFLPLNTFNLEQLALAQKQADTFSQAVTLLLAEPTSENLTHAQNIWHRLEKSYSSFIPATFQNISGSDYLLKYNEQVVTLNLRISARPIQPGFIDSYGDYPFSGITHDLSTSITKPSLIKQNMMTSDEDIALGLYAIEYLLFAQNTSRPFNDFLAVTSLNATHEDIGYKNVSETPNNRRRALLHLQTQLVTDDIAALTTLLRTEQLQTVMRTSTGQNQTNSVVLALTEEIAQLMIDTVATTDSTHIVFSTQRLSAEQFKNRTQRLAQALSALSFENNKAIQSQLSSINFQEPSQWQKQLIQALIAIELLIKY